MRLVVLTIYLLLIVGGITMVVPFLITLTTAVANETDYERYSILPSYWWHDDLRFGKYLAEKYGGIRFEHFAVAHGAPPHWSTFKDLGYEDSLDPHFADLRDKPPGQLRRIAQDYEAFLATYDTGNTLPLFSAWNESECQQFLRDKYTDLVKARAAGRGRPPAGDQSELALDLLSRTWNEGLYLYWDRLNFRQELRYAYHLRRWVPPDEPRQRDFLAYVAGLPAATKLPITTRYLWCVFLMDQGVRVGEIDKQYGTTYGSLYRIPPGEVAELPPPLARLWDRFCSDAWPVRLVEITPDAAAGLRPFLRRRFKTAAAMNRKLATDYRTFADVPATTRLPSADALRRLWVEFVLSVPPDRRRRLSAETDYRAFLRDRYTTVQQLNDAYGWGLVSFDRAELPLREVDYDDYVRHRHAYFGRFVTYNFATIVRYIAVRGRALLNTLVLVVLSIGFALTVNPLAAYALSRFRLRASEQILLYLLATMAFPPEVGMIPGFLLLRDLHLLNTFAALVLPGVANGFTVFLLKGFFDSLPQELYEAASIDGASELRMFTTITLPLCKPILAVIALQAFIAAYGGFMWAFLVCQDPDMWTLMVWLYQFMATNASKPLMMAAIVVASIPTLLVFVFCQKIILRGIVIPSMK